MELIKNKIFNLFANCKLVRGYSRSVICDLQRNEIYPIPNSLFTILEYAGTKTIEDIIEIYGDESIDTIKEYFNFLTSKELIFFNNNPEFFPPLNDLWDEPFKITNCIVDLNKVNSNQLIEICKCIGDLPIKALQIRILKNATLNELISLLNTVKPLGLNSIELLIKYNEDYSNDDLINLCQKFRDIFTITIYDSPNTSFLSTKKNAFGQVYFVKDKVYSEKNCGIIKPDFFTINMKTYTESLNYNTCLNRKISIDKKGNIKNCPSMQESFGNIKDTTLAEAIEKPGFKKYWDINKDKIHVCKDCEFRYICTDCRAYIEDPKDILSKPLKCGYNPYNGEWEVWSNNKLKQKAIALYNFNNLD